MMQGLLPDPGQVLAQIRDVARAEIVPRFRNLAEGDITHKRSPRDLVTVADVAAERALAARLRALLPGSLVVGEEAADTDPGVLAQLGGDEPVWLIDPVDGTGNFAAGSPCFAVLVALCRAGEVLAGWIFDPLAERTVWAIAGRGAWCREAGGEERPALVTAGRALSSLRGSLTGRAFDRMQGLAVTRGIAPPTQVVRYGSTGREYADLACGGLDFAQYRRLKPWDHAAGWLVHREAGGFGALRGGAVPQPYRAEPQIVEETLLLAPDETAWRSLDALLD